jgi:hypothetical protein
VAEQQSYRPLTAAEVAALEAGGSWAEDWSGVRVAEGFSPCAVRRCSFTGQVRLGAFGPAVAVPGGSLPSGVRDSTLSNCAVGDGALVQGVGLLSDYDVGPGGCLLNCSRVSMDGESSFGNGVSIEVLNEGGGRELKVFERLSAQLAYLAVCYRHRPKLVAAIDRMAEQWAAKRMSARGSIGAGARVAGCGTLQCVAVGPAATVDGAVLLRNGTVCSRPEARTTVGAGVTAIDFIIGTGSTVDGGAMLSRCFVGQGCRIGRQFSAENSAFFANCEGFHGEAVAVLAGPYTVTHHKSTLLIAGMFSFYNAGSGTNQSNHMYKLGPLHQGVVERGSKTGSFSYLLWPARVGPFSVVIGKHYANFDSRNLPFSYVDEEDGRTVISPALNLFTVGTRRDGDKWPVRDRRTDPERLDLINFPVLSPLTVGRLMVGLAEITALYDAAPREQTYVTYRGASIRRLLCRTARKHYALAVKLYLGSILADRLEAADDLTAPDGAAGAGEWVDLLGLLAPKSEVEAFCDAVESGEVAGLAAAEGRLTAMHAAYAACEWAWAVEAWRQTAGKAPAEMTPEELAAAVGEWRDAAVKLNNMVLGDAEKEFVETSRIGFGVDGDESVRDADFESVRGTYDANKFVRQLREESEQIKARAERLIGGLGAQ